MSNNKISLVYKEKQRFIRFPHNFLELKDNFLTIFNEDKDKNFSFTYLSLVLDKRTDFTELYKKFKENPEKSKNMINVKAIEKNRIINNNQIIDNNALL